MQDSRTEEQQRQNDLPPLAPRNSRPSTPRARGANTSATAGRPARLSHRSRAGCWTCRARKVKCDEIHPRCGGCARLGRDCDWEHRWNFSDATTSTQGKYANVNIAGNAVWDRNAPGPPPRRPPALHDDLPEFATLANDEDRERKAELRRPGTYGVVVTPRSFSDLPEYAGSDYGSRTRRTSTQSSRRGRGSSGGGVSRSSTWVDPNVVVLERFEDSPTSISPGPFSSAGASALRRPSLPDLASFNFSPTQPSASSVLPTPSIIQGSHADEHLLRHFRQYIVPRLAQPQLDSVSGPFSQGSTRNMFETEAAQFTPLYHAICALSALNLSYNGRSTLEEALQHYHKALDSQASHTGPTDMDSDGVFLRHFILFIYDICVPMAVDEGSPDMWALNLNHLQQRAISRYSRRLGCEPFGFTLWTICELDVSACLLGRGTCELARMVMESDMRPPLEQQVPAMDDLSSGIMPSEMQTFMQVLRLRQGLLMHAAKIAHTAQAFREEAAASRNAPSPATFALWQSTATQLQNDLTNFWRQNHPEHFGSDPLLLHGMLPERVSAVLQQTHLHHASLHLYLRTSLFPSQRRIPLAAHADLLADTEARCTQIITLAAHQLATQQLAVRATVFPVFMAGIATSLATSKNEALQLIRGFEAGGLGQNTYRMRQLLEAVYAKQRELFAGGGKMEDAEWLGIARERGFMVVNCGL